MKEKYFCCNGCKTVYEILSQGDLCDYYRMEDKPGISMKSKSQNRFEYLENERVQEKLLSFKNETIGMVDFYLPQIHCSACLWLLENLHRLAPEVVSSRVNFLKKEIQIRFEHQYLSLRKLVELLSSLGYEPKITLDSIEQPKKKPLSRRLIFQVGMAGFAFGNIMLLSLPEYFGLDLESYNQFSGWFAWLNLLLATPVAFYSGQDYLKSAWHSLKQKRLNIDVPIALGVLVLYFRSLYEVVSHTGSGYFDSLCGLLFFLLLGRIFQEKIYHQLSFERDYRSYFPISVSKIIDRKEKETPINEIQKGDRILLRNGELIPVDAYLIKGEAKIDYSFVTGESLPVNQKIGDKIYAGGKQTGEAIELEAISALNQSKLTQLWVNYSESKSNTSTFSALTDRISRYFTPIILLIALASGLIQAHFFDWSTAIEVMSAVLIVACPCALALAAPFAFGHAIRFLGKKDCYLRDSKVIEEMADLRQVVFDKTGTLTAQEEPKISYHGSALNDFEQSVFRAVFEQSNHPLSRMLREKLSAVKKIQIDHFEELSGKGLMAVIEGKVYQAGSPKWLNYELAAGKDSLVVLAFEKEVLGYFKIEQQYRKGLENTLYRLAKNYKLALISGDQTGERTHLQDFFPKNSELHFNQSPEEKLKFIRRQQIKGEKVMMPEHFAKLM